MKPVYAFTFKGKIIVGIIQFIFFWVHLFKGKKWSRPRPNFSEDPAHYSFIDIVYFGYKYYYKPHLIAEPNDQKKQTVTPLLENSNSKSEKIVTISAGGDLMPYEWIDENYCKHLWDEIGTDFFGSDIVIANLETPIDTFKPAGFVPEIMLNDMEFNANEAMFKVFNGNEQYKGFDVLSTANNHSFDKAESGIINTLNFLKQKQVATCGTAAKPEEIHDFPILERNGIKIAFLSYTYSLNHLHLPTDKSYLCNHIELNKPNCDLSLITQQVKLAHQRGADFVIASVHYGNAYQLYPGNHIIDTTYRIFDECGVDIILGGHAHNIQPVEYYNFKCPLTQQGKTGLVTYCMGDFVAYDIFTWGHLPIWIKFEITKSESSTTIKSVKINPIYTAGIYENKSNRKLKFYNAKNLWKDIENHKSIDLPKFNISEALYLKGIFERVFGGMCES